MTEQSVNDLSDIEDDLARIMIQRYCNTNQNVLLISLNKSQNRPSIDIVLQDLECYKQRIDKKHTSRVITTLNLIYDKTTGCYLF